MAKTLDSRYWDTSEDIETNVIRFYKQNPDLSDHNVLRVVEALQRAYSAELAKKTIPKAKLNELDQALYNVVQPVCERWLGRDPAWGNKHNLKTLDEMVLCLKYIRGSVQFWTKDSGRVAYLNFVSQNVKP